MNLAADVTVWGVAAPMFTRGDYPFVSTSPPSPAVDDQAEASGHGLPPPHDGALRRTQPGGFRRSGALAPNMCSELLSGRIVSTLLRMALERGHRCAKRVG